MAVIIYRLAVAGAIYRALNGLPLGPSVGDLVVSITGAAIQLVAIIIMNKLYEFVALKLTDWGELYVAVCVTGVRTVPGLDLSLIC